MIKKILNNILSTILKIIILGTAVYILFNISKSVWRNWQVNQEIKKTEKSLLELEKEKENLQNQIIYYQTTTFKELEARRKLGLKKPDENVVLVPENVDSGQKQKTSFENKNNQEENKKIPNPLKWWRYLIAE